MKRLIVGISGASGVLYSIRLLEIISNFLKEIEIHLIISKSAEKIIKLETSINVNDIQRFANFVYDVKDLASSISSGSFKTFGMVIIPCSIKTLSNIAYSNNYELISRAADVILKESRRLILVVRETPLHIGHLELMMKAAKLGAKIMPPMPAFYHKPTKIMDIVDQTINRILDQLNLTLPYDLFTRWFKK